ncbi:MAG: NTP transferase domain-containing protein [Candidatus Palauibacterales bacterium]|nr:NTP transferase domain-containing protein [Candidatus Palauibacterales bacterium]MDP2529535.1 NTP transferase domain-containing protein [Candidatus Palauibacterales bacterium]MDP2582513.1 NTP transferase domain-containing protein [Candidatus Palauibacterales bacterium]
MIADDTPADARERPPERRGSFVLLAGGSSRRMGRDKARLRIDGVPLLLRVLDAGRRACLEGILVTDRPGRYADLLESRPHPEWPLRAVTDRRPDRGPLAGLEAGLAAASLPLCFVAACDLAYLDPALVTGLLLALSGDVTAAGAKGAGSGPGEPGDAPRAVVPVRGGREQPLCAAYERRAAATATACLDAGASRVDALLDHLSLRRLPEAELEAWLKRPDASSWTLDLDRPAELGEARRRLESGERVSPVPGTVRPESDLSGGNR